MSKQLKQKQSPSNCQILSGSAIKKKILPHKLSFIMVQTNYDYGARYKLDRHVVKNPKWCYLTLRLGHHDSPSKYNKLGEIRSLRLLSLRFSSYYLDSQWCGDSVLSYYGELDRLTKASRTLKKLSLSVTLNGNKNDDHEDATAENRIIDEDVDVDDFKGYRKRANERLIKFVKSQKHLEKIGLYAEDCGDSGKIVHLLQYLQHSTKMLTLQNFSIRNLFEICTFTKLETLRFQYIIFGGSVLNFDFSLLYEELDDILSLPFLKNLIFAQFQRSDLASYYSEDCYKPDPECKSVEDMKALVEFPIKFWELLRKKLEKQKEKPLRIKYFKHDEYDENDGAESDDSDYKYKRGQKKSKVGKVQALLKNATVVKEKLMAFKRIFSDLEGKQMFEYELENFLAEYEERPGIILRMPEGRIKIKFNKKKEQDKDDSDEEEEEEYVEEEIEKDGQDKNGNNDENKFDEEEDDKDDDEDN